MSIRKWWQNRSPQYKSVLIIFVILLAIGIPGATLILHTQRQSAESSLRQSALSIAELIRGNVNENMLINNRPHLEATLIEVNDGGYINKVLITSNSGQIFFSSDNADIGKTYFDPELASVVTSKETLFRTRNDNSHGEVLEVILPIFNEPGCQNCHNTTAATLGLLQVALNTGAVNTQTERTASLMILIASVTFILIGAALVYMLRQGVLKPLTNRLTDVVDEKEREEKLYLTGRLSTIGELTAGIAHELNNPLTSVIGFSELLQSADVSEEVKQDLQVINREAQRTSQIVRNLLTFARKHPDEKKLISVNDTVRGSLELRAYEQKMNNIRVITKLAPDLPQITANPFQLEQCFINIIINAEYFMGKEHGKGILTVTSERYGDTVRISFADDGPGIPKENLSHIFDPFFTTKDVGKGTGLGLSICFGIITEHGGKVYAESEAGKGAVFIVELPLNNPALPPTTGLEAKKV